MKVNVLFVRTSEVLFSVGLFVHFSDSRDFHVSVLRAKVLKSGYISQLQSMRIVECIYKCVQTPGCRCALFNKPSTICYLYSSAFLSGEKGTVFLYARLRQRNNSARAETEQTSQLLNSNESSKHLDKKGLHGDNGEKANYESMLFVRKISCPASKVWSVCQRENATPFGINSEAKQNAAATLAKQSGLKLLATGVFYCLKCLSWMYDAQEPVTYTAWAPGYPNVGIYSALSKQQGYKWESVMYRVDGVLCQYANNGSKLQGLTAAIDADPNGGSKISVRNFKRRSILFESYFDSFINNNTDTNMADIQPKMMQNWPKHN